MAMPQYKLRTITCCHCGKIKEARMPAGRKFCSLDCYRSAPKPDRKTGIHTVCGSCSKDIYVSKSQVRPTNYCSPACHDKAQSKKDKYICLNCGNDFYWSPSRAKQQPKYCGVECRTKSPEWQQRMIQANLVQQHKKGLNNLELLGQKILQDIGVPFQEQFLMFDKFLVDVFLPDYNIVIQWDGDYWHGYNGAKDERQKNRQKLDKSQDAYMRKSGVKVLRFWEHEVKKEREKVIEAISRAIQ
jgi:very-short-patch-repair endonuclease